MKILIFYAIFLVINMASCAPNYGPYSPYYPPRYPAPYPSFRSLPGEGFNMFESFLPLLNEMTAADPIGAAKMGSFLQPFSKKKTPLYEALKSGALQKGQNYESSNSFSSNLNTVEAPGIYKKDYNSNFDENNNGITHGGYTYTDPYGALQTVTW